MLTGKRVLILENVPLIAVDIESVMADLGAVEIMTLSDGDTEALSNTKIGAHDLAVIDLQSPAESSQKVLIQTQRSGIPVIFLTTEPGRPEDLEYSGLSTVVQKPFTHDQLRSAIAAVMN